MDLLQQIKNLLEQHNITFQLKQHLPTITSEDSARERGEPINIGAKALLIKTDDGFHLCVLPADRRMDMEKLKVIFNSKKVRMATGEELTQVTGCTKGAVPPFGNLIGVDMIVDKAQFDEEYMAFNAGSLMHSIKMKTKDYLNCINPKIEEFSIKN
ncbi:hypothetical protein J4457_07660 [Candidatus Woesearchaeota archaeon]|nr:hypothetical protein [Candidatus Woesearchaeota archaeon]